jgi:hypothetical protein
LATAARRKLRRIITQITAYWIRNAITFAPTA